MLRNNKQTLGGKTPLPMCVQCVEHKMLTPTFQGVPTNFLEKSKQYKAAKGAQHDKAVSRGLRRPTQYKK